jgi:hypothetical protein
MKDMRYLVSIVFFASLLPVFSQVNTLRSAPVGLLGNSSCAGATVVCDQWQDAFDYTREYCTTGAEFYYQFNVLSATTLNLTLQLQGGSYTFDVYGPFQDASLSNCEVIANHQATVTSGQFAAGTHPVNFQAQAGVYYLKLRSSSCTGSISINASANKQALTCDNRILCTECVTSFSPTPGLYVVSAWVKENTTAQVATYSNAIIRVSFPGANTSIDLQAQGRIIDGWQRIEKVIEVPVAATGIEISLIANQVDAYFDDIRFFPTDGSMMSYVYDPISLRLMAELDERNFATLYEYDEEGKLIRVKKETEKGIMTIQENRDNIKK